MPTFQIGSGYEHALALMRHLDAHILTLFDRTLSYGATLFWMLTGQAPLSQGREGDPVLPRRIDRSIPGELQNICMKALEKDPAVRYASAREMAADLDRWLRGDVTLARPITAVERLNRWRRRNPLVAGLIGAPAADGVHMYNGARLNNIRWTDVGEDAATVKSSNNSTFTISGGSTRQSADKTFQMNAGGTFTIYHRGMKGPIGRLEKADHGLRFEHWGREGVNGPWRRVFFVPEAKVIAVLPVSNDRVVLHKFDDLKEYQRFIAATPAEAEALFHDILISVTSFFRNPEGFDLLKERVFPELIRDRSPHLPLRLWVLGCSTGEEAYSMAILFSEFAAGVGRALPVQIMAINRGGELVPFISE